MTARAAPARHWRSYESDPLPTCEEALAEPLRAFPSCFLRIVFERCGKERVITETRMPQGDAPMRDMLTIRSRRLHHTKSE
jgi:hypothetical protein